MKNNRRVTVTCERCCSTSHLRGSRTCREVKTSTSGSSIASTAPFARSCCWKHDKRLYFTVRRLKQSRGGRGEVGGAYRQRGAARGIKPPGVGEEHSEGQRVSHRESPQANLHQQKNPAGQPNSLPEAK